MIQKTQPETPGDLNEESIKKLINFYQSLEGIDKKTLTQIYPWLKDESSKYYS